MATVLAAAALRRDLAPEVRIGPAGIAMLPNRAPPEGQRYRVTLEGARGAGALSAGCPSTGRRPAAQSDRGECALLCYR